MSFKIAWITDSHLNFLEKPEREVFYTQIKEFDVSGVLITGDIAESKNICSLLNEFSTNLNQPIYFVLGNHDYYFSNVVDVRAKIQQACSLNKNLKWLGQGDIIQLNESTVLVGQTHVMATLKRAQSG
jgi:predicted MPP superfamily phosphohydrolase